MLITLRQWGVDPAELDAAVASRVPARLTRDCRYFTDHYQLMPKQGFTVMFEKMLSHPNIHILLNADLADVDGVIPYAEMIYTGPVDEFFDCRYGKLPHISMRFNFETLDTEIFQPVAVVNYPNDFAFTRITEYKHLTGQVHPKTTISYEYPNEGGDPYYPIPQRENAVLYSRCAALADRTAGVYFTGRLATYKYYNMDQVVSQSLDFFARLDQSAASRRRWFHQKWGLNHMNRLRAPFLAMKVLWQVQNCSDSPNLIP